MTPQEREDIAMAFVEAHTRPGEPVTYRQIAEHLTAKTGVPHNRNMVAGIMSRALRRQQQRDGPQAA